MLDRGGAGLGHLVVEDEGGVGWLAVGVVVAEHGAGEVVFAEVGVFV